MKKYKDVIVSIAVIIIAIFFFLLSYTTERETISTLGPDFMPKIVSIALFILGIINLITSITNYRRKCKQDIAYIVSEPKEKKSFKEYFISNLDWVSAIIMLLYVYSIKPLGFIVASAIYIFLQSYVMSLNAKRNYVWFIIVSIAVPLIIYLLFTKVFYIMLPTGILG